MTIYAGGKNLTELTETDLPVLEKYLREIRKDLGIDENKSGDNETAQEGMKEACSGDGKELSPSRIKAVAVYEYALGYIEGADNMTRAELFNAVRDRLESEAAKAYGNEAEKLGELMDSLPPNAETFGKYLRDAGIKKYNSRGDRQFGPSIRRQSEI